MDNKKIPHLVVDLKKKKEETTSNNNNHNFRQNKKSNVLFGLRNIFSTKKNKEINFLNSFSFDEPEFSDEDIARDYFQDKSGPDSRYRPSFLGFLLLPFRILQKIFKAPIFLVKFTVILTIRILALLGKKTKSLTRPRFGDNPHKLSASMFLGMILKSPFKYLRGLVNFKDNLRESRQQQKLLFEELSVKSQSSLRQAVSFTVLVLLLIMPFKAFSYYQIIKNDDLKGRVLGATSDAISSLKSAQSSIGDLSMSDASLDFSKAGDSFRKAKKEISEIDDVVLRLAKIFPHKDVRLAGLSKEILTIGELTSELGINLSLAFNGFIGDQKDELDTPTAFDRFLKYEKKALENVKDINNILKQLSTKDLPDEYQEIFDLLKEKTLDLEVTLSEINQLGESVGIFLGMDYDKRYLVVFQNNNEARATGGFIGSFALVDFSKGKIKNIEIPGGGSYDTEGGLYAEVVSPAPLHLVNPMWHFWDANWWPDWEKSAEKLIWFYEKSGGPTVDGVISLTPTVLEKFLKITGPIDMTETHGVVMDADNFWINIRTIIEEEKNNDLTLPSELVDNKPKKIIGEFFQRLISQLPNHLNKDSIIGFLSAAEASLEEKQALFYFKDKELQEQVVARNWAGKIKNTNKDYLMVVNTNIAGGKSDKSIEQDIIHSVEIADDGSIIDTLKIKRNHTAINGEPFFGVRNVNWMRIYVPLGSELMEASGFRGPDPIYFDNPESDWIIDKDVLAEESQMDIDRENQNTFVYNESGKTVFANWSMIDPEQEGIITLKYKLPFRLEKQNVETEKNSGLTNIFNKIMKIEKKELYAYSLLAQKQPGQRFTSLNFKLDLSSNFKAIWKYPKDLDSNDIVWNFSNEFNQDEYLALILTAK